MKLVIKYGGSLLFDNDRINTELIDRICDTIRELHEKGHELGLVVGGGKTARNYISSLNSNYGTANKDYVAVLATRLNAMLFISRLSDISCPLPPSNFEDMMNYALSDNIIISGGMQPGQSTNAVATLLCEAMGANVMINATNVDYIYDMDPNKYKEAKPLKSMDYKALQGIIADIESDAGRYDMFDMVAAKNIERSGITLHFINGNEPKNIQMIIDGIAIGTRVSID